MEITIIIVLSTIIILLACYIIYLKHKLHVVTINGKKVTVGDINQSTLETFKNVSDNSEKIADAYNNLKEAKEQLNTIKSDDENV